MLIAYVNQLFPSPALQSDTVKYYSMFLTDNQFMFTKNNLLLAQLPAISVNLNKNYRHYNFQAIANISRNIKFPGNLQPYLYFFSQRVINRWNSIIKGSTHRQ